MRRAARTDGNHGSMVESLRALGFSVLSLAGLGKGVPDLLIARNGRNWLVEVKKPKGPRGGGGGRLTPDQVKFHAEWKARIVVARDLGDVVLATSGQGEV